MRAARSGNSRVSGTEQPAGRVGRSLGVAGEQPENSHWLKVPARPASESRGTANRGLRCPHMRPHHDGTDIPLPLTEVPAPATLGHEIITRETIRLIVEAFYAECRRHPVLGPIFNRHVQDWDMHLARIQSFWAAALLKVGGYSGRPLEAHLAIPDLNPEHFSMWLKLFAQSVASQHPPLAAKDAARFMTLAGRMANRLIAAGAESRTVNGPQDQVTPEQV